MGLGKERSLCLVTCNSQRLGQINNICTTQDGKERLCSDISNKRPPIPAYLSAFRRFSRHEIRACIAMDLACVKWP